MDQKLDQKFTMELSTIENGLPESVNLIEQGETGFISRYCLTFADSFQMIFQLITILSEP